MKYLSLFVLFISLFANADNCEEVRLDKNGGIMEKVPPVNQGSFGICYAVAAQQVFDAYRFKKKTSDKKLSSPHHAAIMQALERKRNGEPKVSVDGGWVYSTFLNLFEGGGCEKNYFESKHDTRKLEKKLDQVISLKQSYDASLVFKGRDNFARYEPAPYKGLEWMAPHYSKLSHKVNYEIAGAKHAYENNPSCLSSTLSDIGVDVNDKNKLMNLLYKGELEKFEKELQVITCPKEKLLKVVPEPKISTPSYYDHENASRLWLEHEQKRRNKNLTPDQRRALNDKYSKLMDKILEDSNSPVYRGQVGKKWVADKLKKDGMPVAISYCANKVMSGFSKLFGGDDCGGHASVIIGRKKNLKTGKCQVLIRNSWGESVNFLKYNRHITPDRTNYWVDEDTIYHTGLLSLETLE